MFQKSRITLIISVEIKTVLLKAVFFNRNLLENYAIVKSEFSYTSYR